MTSLFRGSLNRGSINSIKSIKEQRWLWVSISINCSIKSITLQFELSMLSYLFTSIAKDMNSERSRTNPASGKSWTWTRDRRIASPTRWQLGHAATNWSVRKWYSWINSGDRCNIWNIIDTSTILSTQGWINSIATSHSKMGSVFKVWTKPGWKRRQRGWNWHTFQPTSLSIFTANNGHNNYLKNWYRSCYNKISSNKNKP